MVSDEKNTKLANKENLINQSLKEFKEKDEFMANLERLLTGSLLECELERFLMVLDLYQENPKILDPFLQSIVLPIIECLNVSLTVSGCIAKLGLFRLLYRLCKTIGYKSIQKFFTHDAEIMFPILVVLNGIPNSITQYWEIRYILVLWLSLAVMIPIDFKRLENSSQFKKLQLECNSNDGLRTLLLTQGKSLLSQAGVEFEAAALLCTRVISRTDSIEHLGEFVAGVIEDVRQSSDVFQTRGSLYCLCMLYKLVPSEELRKLNEHLLPFLSKVGVQGFKNIRLHQKLFIKLSQRVGKSLIIPDQEFSIDGIPEEIETIVSILLENLTGNDTVVRWSAAKGIGRICSRLPSDFVNQIVEEIVNLISEDSLSTGSVIEVSICSDKTWHGGVLAFSELARRCLLQAENLKLVIPWMNRALSFEIDKGTYSLGSNVRDSACYFFWSLARAYGSAELEQYANPIACSLVATALLDREVGVRRAASAAFQENAGRHNIYPNRLEIIALADYFAVGSRVGCYTEIVVEVCKFDSYRHELLENLKFRVTHWNESIRELSSKSLGLIASEYPEEVISILEFILSIPLKSCSETHGILISSAEIISGLIRNKIGVRGLPTSVIQKVGSMVGNLDTVLLDGFGSELVHVAIAKHVRLLSSMPFVRCLTNSKKTASLWLEVLEKTLRRSSDTLQANAALALKELFSIEHLFDFKHILDRFVQFIRPESQKYTRRGFATAMGSFPVKVTVEFLPLLIDNLIATASLPVNASENDAECRRNAIQAIIFILLDLSPLKEDEQIVQCMENAFECFSAASGDYSVDSRGDVGSLIREVSLSGMEAYVDISMQQGRSISSNKVYVILNAVILGCFEKIDNIRDSAGKILDRFIDSNLVQFPWKTKLTSVIKDRHDDFEWMSAKHTIPLLTKLIEIPEITDTVVLGLAINVGGLTESLVNSATSALTYYLGRAKDFNLILSSLGKIFVEYQRNDRVSVPLLETVNFLIEAGYLSLDWPEQPTRIIFNSVQKEIMKSKNSVKIHLGIKM